MKRGLDVQSVVRSLGPALQASLDPIALVDRDGRIVHHNSALRALLQLTPRQVSRGVVFCDHVKLKVCEKGCQVLAAMETGELFQFDQVPATIGEQKMRLLGRVVPIRGDWPGGGAAGALICVRDVSAELLVQAKYHRLLETVETQKGQLDELKTRLESLRAVIRGRRVKG